MKRMTMTGLSVLLLSTVLASSAMAGSRTEPRLIKDTNPEFHSTQTERQQAIQPNAQMPGRENQVSMNDADPQIAEMEQSEARAGNSRFQTALREEHDK